MAGQSESRHSVCTELSNATAPVLGVRGDASFDIPHNEFDALDRRRRGNRDVVEASLQHSVQGDQQLDGAVHADHHRLFGGGAQMLQVAGELVGAGVQLSIGHSRAFEPERNGIGRRGGLELKQLMDRQRVASLRLLVGG